MVRNPFAVIGLLGLAGIVGCYRPDPVAPQANVASAGPSVSASGTSVRPSASVAAATASGSPSATAAGTHPASTEPASTKPTPLVSARVAKDRFTPPDRGLPPEMRTPVAPPQSRSPRSPRAAGSGSRPARTRVLDAPESAGGFAGISFDDLVFDILPDQPFDPSMFNDGVRSLFGRKIKIRGYIHPYTMQFDTGNTAFVLVRDNQDCCFGPGAALYDCIFVQMNPGRTADFRSIPVAVTGTLRFQEHREGEATRAVFRLEADAVE
jgi:hypothetical protein